MEDLVTAQVDNCAKYGLSLWAEMGLSQSGLQWQNLQL